MRPISLSDNILSICRGVDEKRQDCHITTVKDLSFIAPKLAILLYILYEANVMFFHCSSFWSNELKHYDVQHQNHFVFCMLRQQKNTIILASRVAEWGAHLCTEEEITPSNTCILPLLSMQEMCHTGYQEIGRCSTRGESEEWHEGKKECKQEIQPSFETQGRCHQNS